MAPGEFNGKDFGGGHTGMGWYHYNWHSVANYKDSYPTNKNLVEGQKVTYIGKNKNYKNTSGVVLKRDKKCGRSWFPIRLEVFDKNSSSFKFRTVYCVKTQLQMPIVLKDKREEKMNKLTYNRELRKRKKLKFNKQKLNKQKY